MRGWELHWGRFVDACLSVGAPANGLDDVRGATARALPNQGRWFPRVEWRSDGRFVLRVREAPPRLRSAVCWVADACDDRCQPRHKGPDLERLTHWRQLAALQGADETLLLDEHGRLLEGAFSSLLWWDGEALVFVPDEAPILAGVTRALLRALAVERGVPIREQIVGATELAGREVWLASALHGIRGVTEILPGVVTGPVRRARSWQAMLEQLSRPLADLHPAPQPV